ncbi:class I SAM-dependent methyltransferase [Carboxylicivirga linearis]|uniref:Class I SAM-dependent methyltransferase n=1 Tax=Carboxylicivirga linearis TaxID=1628157 RepID=A0ABS5JVQ4_9BACT|nr:class I SAM-dependent methyltransferase [Carboxylicivirga linearis]MBS2098551.1 class I SAM-dependent methyltransferase [Carboxylicivirga linearis]
MDKIICHVCKNEKFSSHIYEEMMYGTKDEFLYLECEHCKTLRIQDTPSNLASYYPKDYYSFKKPYFKKENFLLRWVKAIIINNKERKITKKLFSSRINYLKSNIPFYFDKIKATSKVLDVGCGSGLKLYNLYRLGYNNLLGIDKYNEKEVNYNRNFRILNGDFQNLNDKYDFIILRHVLEHLPNQSENIKKLADLLNDNGLLAISIPIREKAYEIYGKYWVQLDVPRHLYLYTHQSFLLFIEKECNLKVLDYRFESSDFQLWGSELYKWDISLHQFENNKESIHNYFSKNDLDGFKRTAEQWNKKEIGDAVTYIIRKEA